MGPVITKERVAQSEQVDQMWIMHNVSYVTTMKK
jgi:hypothetical protein